MSAVITGSIDLRFITLLCAGVASVMSIVFLEQARNRNDNVQGLRWWAAGPIAILLGSVLLGARGYISVWLSAVSANMFISGGVLAFYIGLRRFYGLEVRRWPMLLVALIGASSYYYSIFEPDYRARIAIFAGVVFFFEAAQTATLIRYSPKSFSSRFLLISSLVMIAALLLRLTTAIYEEKDGDLFAPSLVQNIYLATYGIVFVAQSVGFMLLYHDRLRKQIEELANRDFLTELLTRGAAFKQGIELTQEQDSSKQPLSALMFDLDHFKIVNDTWGHLKGDVALQAFAQLGRQHLRETDLFSRYGGEEFLAILPATPINEALWIAERIRAAQELSENPRITVSVGVATLQPNHDNEQPITRFERLLNAADKALYVAKQTGRNRIVQATDAGTAVR